MAKGHRKFFPNALFKITNFLAHSWFRIHLKEHGSHSATMPGGVYIANYQSWVDSLLLIVTIDDLLGRYIFALNYRHRNHWWAKLTARLVPVIYYDPVRADAEGNLQLIEAIRTDHSVIIFPEGRPTNTGTLLPICPGIASVLAQTSPPLYPLFITGSKESIFSAVQPKQQRTHYWPDVYIHRFLSVPFKMPIAGKGRDQSEKAATFIYDLLSQKAFEQFNTKRTLFSSLLDASKSFGAGFQILEDTERLAIPYRKLIAGSYILGKAMVKELAPGEQTVGLMLPNVNGGVVAFMGLQAYGKTPALLNFTSGRKNILSACHTVQLKTVITSRRFIKLAELEAILEALTTEGLRVIFLEDLREKINLRGKISGFAKALFGHKAYRKIHRNYPERIKPNQPALVLFTSGSEGLPKGVALSHSNLLANVGQLQSRIDFGINDRIFNPLPMFHTSGLTGGIILPLLSGMRIFLYPSPLHYQVIPELIADTQSTVLFATDTFLAGYARYARAYDLHRLRYVFAGAEKLREETRKQWGERFGVRIFEGYGVTETAPVLAFNTPMFSKPGTVGRLSPGLSHQIFTVEGIKQGGRLVVYGPNIMAGYYLPEQPGVLVPPKDGWHDTGDIVSIDENGFISILGRAKRFAKIAGEMVSFGAVEGALAKLWPEHEHAVIAVPDSKKGEQLVLFTTKKDPARDAVIAHFRDKGLPELYLPRQIIHLPELPVLGSGKVDYPALQGQALTTPKTTTSEASETEPSHDDKNPA